MVPPYRRGQTGTGPAPFDPEIPVLDSDRLAYAIQNWSSDPPPTPALFVQPRLMANGVLSPVINCADLVATSGWYERVLSATIDHRFPEDGQAEYLTLRIGSGQLGLGWATSWPMTG